MDVDNLDAVQRRVLEEVSADWHMLWELAAGPEGITAEALAAARQAVRALYDHGLVRLERCTWPTGPRVAVTGEVLDVDAEWESHRPDYVEVTTTHAGEALLR